MKRPMTTKDLFEKICSILEGKRLVPDILEDRNAMHRMSGLLADFIVEAYAYVNANLDDFTWEGVNVHPLDADGKKSGGEYSCSSMEMALEKKDILLKEYPYVLVRDNRTRKEERFRGGGVS